MWPIFQKFQKMVIIFSSSKENNLHHNFLLKGNPTIDQGLNAGKGYYCLV